MSDQGPSRRAACLWLRRVVLGLLVAGLCPADCCRAETVLPPLPSANGAVEIPAQEWPYRPGPRTIRVHVRYPAGQLAGVTAQTGLMLTLHNWGGEAFVGAPDPAELVREFQVVAIGVDYLQSGRVDSIEAPEPYDFGWLQALDVLRALHYVREQLLQAHIPFDDSRLFATGGSGGGNVTLMAHKLAPRTFAAIVPICGMAKLSDDIAFNLPGGSGLNARYHQDPRHRNFLLRDEQELRFIGHPGHARQMMELGCRTKMVVVHGEEDTTCPFEDAAEMATNLREAGLDVDFFAVHASDRDGKAFANTGHSLGNRTEIVKRVAGDYLRPGTARSRSRQGMSDFDRHEAIRFPTTQGQFVVEYGDGPPVGRFEYSVPPSYPDHVSLARVANEQGELRPIENGADWQQRRRHVVQALLQVTGPLPPAAHRVPLDVQVIEERVIEGIRCRKLTFQSDPNDRVAAWLLLPELSADTPAKRPAVLALHQTVAIGKEEVAGFGGDPELKYGWELAQRGFVVLAPDYPTLGEHRWEPADYPQYASGTIKAIWDNGRAVDLLQELPQVDPERIGVIGHSLGAHNGLFTAVLDERLKVVVSSCGFTRMVDDDVPSWNGPRYMPRIATRFGNSARQLPFDFPEIVASLAPRPFFCSACVGDSDFAVSGVRATVEEAGKIYTLLGAADHLVAIYPEADHSFPVAARQAAVAFMAQHLGLPPFKRP